MDTKTCTKCGVEKGMGEFGIDRHRKSGRLSSCVACGNERKRAWYAANREGCKARTQQWREAHPEERKASDRAYREATAEKQKERKKAWRAKHVEDEKARQRAYRTLYFEVAKVRSQAWRAAHREEEKARHQAWRAAHHDVVKTKERRRRDRKHNAPGTCTAAQLSERCAMWGNKCWMCGKPAEAVDHVKPLAKDGAAWPCNLRPICGTCNSAKGAKWPLSEIAHLLTPGVAANERNA